MTKVLISLSAGMDSTTLLGLALDKGHEVHLVHFQYGSKHNLQERIAVNRVLQFYGLGVISVIDLTAMMSNIKSNLLQSGGEIPEGHYQAESMKQTVVPGRNLIFAAIAASLAESNGIEEVWLGIHTGDHAIYPDCRESFYQAAATTISESTEGRVKLRAPFLAIDKVGILKIGYGLQNVQPVPYDITRTCYKEDLHACGKCGSCQERLLAFKAIGVRDPAQYSYMDPEFVEFFNHCEMPDSTELGIVKELDPVLNAFDEVEDFKGPGVGNHPNVKVVDKKLEIPEEAKPSAQVKRKPR